MGLAETVAAAAQKALQATGNLRATCTFRRLTLGAYNPATDAQTETAATTTVLGILSKEKTAEGAKADARDMKLLLSALDLGFEPKPDDNLTINSVTHEIVNVKFVPGRSVYILTVRVT